MAKLKVREFSIKYAKKTEESTINKPLKTAGKQNLPILEKIVQNRRRYNKKQNDVVKRERKTAGIS